LLNEKERRDRDCKNMQVELNRINTMMHTFKNSAGGGEMKISQTPANEGAYYGGGN
jgi:hypothetical protein